MNAEQTKKFQYEIGKILALGLDITGELVEIALTQVFPQAKRITLNTKDKKWIDVILPSRGLEVKTFQVAKSIKSITVGTVVSNVLKRVSQVEHTDHEGNVRDAKDIGKDLINYLHSTIEEHSTIKGVTGEKAMAVLFRTVDNSKFAYWEQPLNFGNYEDYDWQWNETISNGKVTHTIVGIKEGKYIFRWYCNNQKQLFYLYEVPEAATFFEVSKKESQQEVFIMTKEELDQKLSEAFRKGQQNK
ncbi:hypothetical protein [Brevibacillus borstelensis]